MRAKVRATLLLTLSLFLMIALAACGGSKDDKKSTDSTGTTTETKTETGSEETSAYKDKYDPPVSISTVWAVAPEVKFKNGETIENNVATKWAKDTLGIEIKSLWSVANTNNAFATKLRLALTSGQELPDVVVAGSEDPQLIQDLIDSGAFQDAGALFDKYANDTWKSAMNLDSNVWNPYLRDGARMAIPILDYAYNNDYLLWIRQDWLDKLNLKAPTTIEELETVMEAFKNNNPSGLAPDKVVPLSIGFKTSMNTWMGDPSWIFGAYGTVPQQWNVGADGKLEWGSVNAGMKQGLTKLNEWYTKGWIPKEAALWDENKTSEPAVAGTAGIIPGPYWMSGWPLQDTVKNDPDAVWKPIALPAGPDGKVGRHGTSFSNGVILINKDMKNPEALFTYQNYMFDNLADPQPGGPFENGLFKGYDYELDANGNAVYGDDNIPGGAMSTVRYLLVRDGARIPDAQMKALLNLADGKEPTTRMEKDLKNNFGKETPAAAVVLMGQKDAGLMNMYTGPTTETMKTKFDYLKKIEAQTFNEIIYGEKPADAFDKFVETWKSSGGDQITAEVNTWYDGIKK
ncbi:carbohydrate ABC transporter substrate-binding protein (CUT1 family) [Paenibacillus cellulosilyticus]|uniref:Carbohydrate ABC transporter substrate-binding protein (CUT1 family) n=1 Tax=Paenibacillus cellulosilyticus TaxID=375489 RepID=A0A2V2YGV3_9BACL|nr:extracellular solute-binding protein [Paenibacillus cellulosilyticus]PWV92117.1 carbohydrate ABC transporter substrate-binding protein (CUT1 family) [Paenibacillus cellulosilyticus]QKS44225.1 extracellular solute-binding protein [Paenibacillus cellulosilyticus]